jgi:membrane-associated phospholipid phosphatase
MAATVGVPAEGQKRPWKRAAAWLALLVPLFFLTYGAANELASWRTDVPSVVFDWERHIPFLAWTIIPYWSIDVLYAVSLFLCTSRAGLDTHVRRLLTAQVVAVACFILFPLKFAWAKPETSGVSGFLFDALASFDKPFNQAPSLHIALLVVLWDLYRKQVPRSWHWLLHGYFALIGVSVLTTWQHHFIDVPTGALLGLFCLWLWPDNLPSPLAGAKVTRDRARLRLATAYFGGALACALLAGFLGGWALWLFWPAVSLLLVVLAYAVLGAAAFQKDGRGAMSLAAGCLLWPYCVGAWINSRAWTRSLPQAVEVAAPVWLGRIPTASGSAFSSVVDLAAELPAPTRAGRWWAFPALDLVTPAPCLLREAAAAIERETALANRGDGRVLVCCALGLSRSAAALATWLASTGRSRDAAGAIAMVKAVRPEVVLGPDHQLAIEQALLLRKDRP